MSLIQQIQYCEKPFPHFIIDNFLSTVMVKQFLDECIKHKDKFVGADVGSSENQYVDDCPACKIQRNINRLVKRKNDVLYLAHLKDGLIFNTGIAAALNDNAFKELMSAAPSMFPIMNNTDSTELILSRHGMCDFYGWHSDNVNDPVLMKQRVITVIYYFNTLPQKFTGGELILAGKTIADQKVVEPKNNRCVIFPSQHTHCVSTVKLESEEFKDGRFAINYWVGFK